MEISSLVLRQSSTTLSLSKGVNDGHSRDDVVSNMGMHGLHSLAHARLAAEVAADESASLNACATCPVLVSVALPRPSDAHLVPQIPSPSPHVRLPIHRFPNLFKPRMRSWHLPSQLLHQQPYLQLQSQAEMQSRILPARDPKKLARNREAQRAFRLRQAQRIAHHQYAVAGLAHDVRNRLLFLQQQIDYLADTAGDLQQAIAMANLSETAEVVAGDGGIYPNWVCGDCASSVVTLVDVSDSESERRLEKYRSSLEMLPSLMGTDLARRYLEMSSKLPKCEGTRDIKDCLTQVVAIREELLDECSATDWKRALDILEDIQESQSDAESKARISRAVSDISKAINVEDLKTRAPLVPGFMLKSQLTQALSRIPHLAPMPNLIDNFCDRCWDYFYASDSDGSALFVMLSVFQEVHGLCTQKDERIQLSRAVDSARQFSKKGKSRFSALQKLI